MAKHQCFKAITKELAKDHQVLQMLLQPIAPLAAAYASVAMTLTEKSLKGEPESVCGAQ